MARQIGMENEEVEIIQSGSIFEAGDIIFDPMRRVILENCPRAKIIHLDCPPVIVAFC